MSPGAGLCRRAYFQRGQLRNHIGFGFAGGKCVHQADNGGGASHVAFHFFHITCWLDGNSARVKAHAFANKGDGLLARFAAIPAHDDHAALMLGPLPDA